MKDIPFIMLKKGHAIRKKTDLVLRQYGIEPKIMIELSSCISAVQLAAAQVLVLPLSPSGRLMRWGEWNVSAVMIFL